MRVEGSKGGWVEEMLVPMVERLDSRDLNR